MTNKDTIAGKAKELGGKAQAKVGELTGNPETQARGRVNEAEGNVQKNYGKLKDAID